MFSLLKTRVRSLSLSDIKDSFLIDSHESVAEIGLRLSRSNKDIYHGCVGIMNLHRYSNGVEIPAVESELIELFSSVVPSNTSTDTMGEIIRYLRIQLLSKSSIQVEKAVIIINHIFLSFSEKVVVAYISRRLFMKTLSVVARRQQAISSPTSLRVADRIFSMIRLWAETYHSLRKRPSCITLTFTKLEYKYGIKFKDLPPGLLKKTCLRIGKNYNYNAEQLLNVLKKDADADFASYNQDFTNEVISTPTSDATQASDQPIVSPPTYEVPSINVNVPDANFDLENVSPNETHNASPIEKPKSFMERIGLSSPPLVDKGRASISRKSSFEGDSNKISKRYAFRTSFGKSQRSNSLTYRSAKTLDIDFSHVPVVRAMWHEVETKVTEQVVSKTQSRSSIVIQAPESEADLL